MSENSIEFVFPPGFFGSGGNPPDVSNFLRWLVEEIAKSGVKVDRGFLSGEFGYGVDFENDVFLMYPDYQDAECTCGFSERAEQWFEQNPHTDDCYSSVLLVELKRFPKQQELEAAETASRCDIFTVNGVQYSDGEKAREDWRRDGGRFTSERSAASEHMHRVWCQIYDEHRIWEKDLLASMCDRFGIPRDKPGAMVHCTCDQEKLRKQFFEQNGHDFRCPIELPNFWHKPSGVMVRWYKWIGREMKISREVSADEWRTVFEDCCRSLRGLNFPRA